MKLALVCTLALLTLTACTPEKRSPDQIRAETAKATSEATRDVKAVAEGVVDGVKQGSPVNINKASEDRLQSLPGIDADTARSIVAARPYDTSSDLVRKHIIGKAEYDRIADKITVH